MGLVTLISSLQVKYNNENKDKLKQKTILKDMKKPGKTFQDQKELGTIEHNNT